MHPLHKRTGALYACPNCQHALSTLRHSPRDLFCRACRTAVVIMDHTSCVYMVPGPTGLNAYCSLERLRRPDLVA